MAAKASDLKYLNIGLPDDLHQELKKAADDRHTTVVALLRSFVKLGLLAIEVENSPDAALIFREKDREREIFII